jgi:hypothetical protein
MTAPVGSGSRARFATYVGYLPPAQFARVPMPMRAACS